MGKSYCSVYPKLASKVAQAFSCSINHANAYMSAYNRFAKPLNMEKIKGDEEIESVVNKLSEFFNAVRGNEAVNNFIKDMMVQVQGNNLSYHYSKLQNIFTHEVYLDLIQDFTRIFVSLWDSITAEDCGLSSGSEVTAKDKKKYIISRIRDKDQNFIRDLLQQSWIEKEGDSSVKYSIIEYFNEINNILGNVDNNTPQETIAQLEEQKSLIVNIVRNANSIFIMALADINSITGAKLSYDILDNSYEYSEEEDVEELTSREVEEVEDNLGVSLDEEVTILEHWMEILDHADPTGSLSEIVKKVIFQTPMYRTISTPIEDTSAGSEYAEVASLSVEVEPIKTSTFGMPRLSNPDVEARRILRLCYKASTISQMMEILKNQPRYTGLYNVLIKDARLQTTFFQAFNKIQQDYSEIISTNDGGKRRFSSPILNRIKRGQTVKSFFRGLQRFIPTQNSIFFLRGKKLAVNYAEYYKFKNLATKLLDNDLEGFNNLKSHDEKVSYMTFLVEKLGIPITQDAIGEIVSDPSTLKELADALLIISSSENEDIFDPTSSKSKFSTVDKLVSNSKIVSRAFTTLFKLVDSTNEFSNSYSNMVSYNGSTLSTYILPSVMNNLFKRIKFMRGDEITGFLENMYLKSPLYAERDEEGNISKIYSRWLRDFYECADAERGSIRTRFSVSRCLGINSTPVEKISDSQHMMIILQSYFNNRKMNKDNIVYISREPKSFSELVSLLAERNATPNINNVYFIEGSAKAVRINAMSEDNGVYKGSIITDVYRDDFAVIPSFITGDTNAIRLFKSLHYNEEEILEGMYDLYLADKADIRQKKAFRDAGYTVKANDKIAYTNSISKFGILQFLNEGKYRARLEEILKDNTGDEVTIKKEFKELCREYLQDETSALMEQLNSKGLDLLRRSSVTSKDSSGNKVHSEVYDNFASVLPENATEEDLKDLLYDFIINYEFSQFNQTVLLLVNPSFFDGVEAHQKRNKVTLTNGIQGAPDTIDPKTGKPVWDLSNAVQRVVSFFDIISSSEGTAFFEALEDVFRDSPNKDKILDDYKASSLTDGYSLRTFESYRKVLLGQGMDRWTNAMEDAYQKIEAIRALCPADKSLGDVIVKDENGNEVNALEYISSLGVVFQPIKPVGQFIEHFAGDKVLGVQLKYAEFPIIPELYPPHSNMRMIGYFMEGKDRNGNRVEGRQPIDLLASSTCFKEGCFGEIDLQYKTVKNIIEKTNEETGEVELESIAQYVDKNGNVIKGFRFNDEGELVEVENPTMYEQRLNKNFSKEAEPYTGNIMDALEGQLYEGSKAVVHELNVSGMLIQTNKPVHPHNEVTVGTQQQKIVIGAIKDDSDYSEQFTMTGSKGTTITKGKELRELYHKVLSAGYGRGLLEFLKTIKKENRPALSTRLASQIVSNRRNNRGNLTKISLENGEFKVPLFDKSLSHDTLPNILSIFKKKVIRQKTYGVSFIQASAIASGIERIDKPELGFKVVTDSKGRKNIVSCDAETGWFFTYIDTNGKEVPIPREKYVDKDGYFLDLNGQPVKEDRWHLEEGEIPTLIERDYPGILDVAANRTPSEMEFSLFRLRIRKVNARVGDNTIKLPLASTTIAGFDFDIDSLTLMVKEFRRKFNPSMNNKGVWDAFYSTTLGSEIYTALGVFAMQKGEVGDLEGLWEEANITERFGITKEEAFEKGVVEGFGSVWEEFDLDKSAFDQSSTACRNAALAITLAVLAHPDTLTDRYTPGGFPLLKRTAAFGRNLLLPTAKDNPMLERSEVKGALTTTIKVVKSLAGFTDKYLKDNPAKPTYNYASPMTSILFKLKNQIADSLIGIAANDDMSHIISNLLNMECIEKGLSVRLGSLLNEPTEINGITKESNPQEFERLLASLGTDFNIQSINGVSVKRMIAEILDGSVDAVKENALEALNLNMVTADVAIAIIKSGHNFDDVFLFLNQPIIKEMCSVVSRTGNSNIWEALNKAFERFGAHINMHNVIKNSSSVPNSEYFTTEALAHNIVYWSEDVSRDELTSFTNSQIEVAKMFIGLYNVRGDYSRFVQETRSTSANSSPTSSGQWETTDYNRGVANNTSLRITDQSGENPIKFVYNEEGFKIETVEDLKALYERFANSPLAFELFVNNIKGYAMNTLFREFTPYLGGVYTTIKGFLRRFVPKTTFNKDFVNKVNDAIIGMLVKNANGDLSIGSTPSIKATDGSELNSEGKSTIDLFMDTNFLNTVAEAMTEEERDILAHSTLLKHLNETEVVEDKFKFTLSFSFNNDSLNAIKQSWATLYKGGNNGTLSAFAKGLFIHFYLNNGLDNTSEFNHGAVPESIMQDLVVHYGTDGVGDISFYDFERGLINEDTDLGVSMDESALRNIAIEYIVAHANDPKVVLNVSDESAFKPVGNMLELKSDKMYLVKIGQDKTHYYVRPMVTFKGKLYILDGFQNSGNNKVPNSEDTIRYIEYESPAPNEFSPFYTSKNNYLVGNVPRITYQETSAVEELDAVPVVSNIGNVIRDLEKKVKNQQAVDGQGNLICGE